MDGQQSDANSGTRRSGPTALIPFTLAPQVWATHPDGADSSAVYFASSPARQASTSCLPLSDSLTS